MTFAEWQAECTRMAGEVEKAAREVKAFQNAGDWASVSEVQQNYYAKRDALHALQALVPDENGVIAAERSMSAEDWLSEHESIAHDLTVVKIEWDKLRSVGDWAAAQGPQEKYYQLRKRQDEHSANKPQTAKG